MNILNALKNDENGFVVSAELVLVGTILVLGMIVGLTELSYGVNEELEDLGSGIGAINQTYYFTLGSGKKGEVVGSTYLDFVDECDNACDITCNTPARGRKSQLLIPPDSFKHTGATVTRPSPVVFQEMTNPGSTGFGLPHLAELRHQPESTIIM